VVTYVYYVVVKYSGIKPHNDAKSIYNIILIPIIYYYVCKDRISVIVSDAINNNLIQNRTRCDNQSIKFLRVGVQTEE